MSYRCAVMHYAMLYICLQYLIVVVQVLRLVHVLADNPVNLDRPVFKVSTKTDTALAVIANLRRIQITNIALAAFNARPIVKYAVLPVHLISTCFLVSQLYHVNNEYTSETKMRTYV